MRHTSTLGSRTRMRTVVVAACGIALLTPTGLALAASPSSHHHLRPVHVGSTTAATKQKVASGNVIVVLRGQANGGKIKGIGTSAVSAATAQSQQSKLKSSILNGGGRVRATFDLVNAVSANLTSKQAQAISRDPSVAEIIPDARIKAPQPAQATSQSASPNVDASGGVAPPANTCPDNPSATQFEPEPVEVTRADSDQPGAITARSLGYDGSGVTVAYMAEGIDINNPDFIRDGHTIFSDYKDFSGDGTAAPTAAGEAFLDASAIGAQGNKTYDISHFSKLPLNRACQIRVEGEAPGVNLVGLKIFGDTYTTTSGFLDAIQYAVRVDHVDVLNQSFGGSPVPDTSEDVIRAADEAAVAAGTTITASTGDAGITNTIGSPASDPAVIAVGASTTYRFDLQTGYAASRFPGITSWLDNNISSLSSGGITQSGRTVDLVAPGELSYAVCSTDLDMYEECADYAGDPLGLEASGGTSESAPRVAGVAALVIQAYRAGHNGQSPTPAQIKSILTSTADDVKAPAEQQGAGMVDAARAVQLAHAYGGAGTATAAVLATGTNHLTSVGNPGGDATFSESFTNQSSTNQVVHVSSRKLGAYRQITRQTADLEDGTSPTYVDFQGITDNYAKLTFQVPAGADRLETSIAYQAASSDLSARTRLTLVDPTGKLAGYSLPQGIGNYGHAEVAKPAAGTWTAYITSRQTSTGGSTGPVVFAAGTANYTSLGTVSPSTLTLAPGVSGSVTLTTPRGATPGDLTGSLVATTKPLGGADPVKGAPDTLADTATTTVPVVLRSVVPAGNQGFNQTLTGPNGRDNYPGVTFSYQIQVPSGTPELNANLVESASPPNQVQAVLVSPEGNATAFSSNVNLTTSPTGGQTSKLVKGLQLHTLQPESGLWTMVVVFAPVTNGQDISSTFRVTTSDTAVHTATNVPNSTDAKVKVGQTITRQIRVINNGPAPEAYFLDPRLSSSRSYDLVSITSSHTSAPYTSVPDYVVPSNTSALVATATTTGTHPMEFDLFGPLGDPDVESNQGTSTRVVYSADPVVSGTWGITAGQVGPSPADGSGQTPEPVNTTLTALTQAFDPTVTSSTGDLWDVSLDPDATFDPVVVQPGDAVTIDVKLKPTSSGTKRGVIYLDDANLVENYYGTFVSPNADQVAAVPYTYTAQ